MPTYDELIAAGELLDAEPTAAKPPKALAAPVMPRSRPKGTEVNRQKHVKTMMKQFGYDASKYDSMLTAQGGKCAICGHPPSSGYLVIDHDHEKGHGSSLRDLLCDGCNRAIGALRDNPDTCEAAAAYLRRHKARRAKEVADYW